MGGNKSRLEKEEEVIYNITYHPEVEADLNEAYNYYEDLRKGLGDNFVLSADACMSYLQRNPFHFQKINKHTRKVNIKKFPFGIFYYIHVDTIYIQSITHLRRNPQAWKKRKTK